MLTLRFNRPNPAMTQTVFNRFHRHRQPVAATAMVFWALCAVWLGCFLGHQQSMLLDEEASAPAHHMHQAVSSMGVEAKHDGHGASGGECCGDQHQPVVLSLVTTLAVGLSLGFVFLFPTRKRSNSGQPLPELRLRRRGRIPRVHLVNCTFLD